MKFAVLRHLLTYCFLAASVVFPIRVWAASAAATGWPMSVTCTTDGSNKVYCTATYQSYGSSQLGHNLTGTPTFSSAVLVPNYYVCVFGMHPTTFATAKECWKLYFTAGNQLQGMNYAGVDSDNDNVGVSFDNCPLITNIDQKDNDSDGIGDVCDSTPNGDDDSDGVDNQIDNCLKVSNASQIDTDGDGFGDECDPVLVNDIDNDGVEDSIDAFPIKREATTDTDGDGKPDSIDTLKLSVFNDFESGVGTGWVLTAASPAYASWGLATNYSVSPSRSLQLTAYRNSVTHSGTVASLSITLETGSSISWYYRHENDNLATGTHSLTIDGQQAFSWCTGVSGGWRFCIAPVSPGTHTFAMNVYSGGMTGNYQKIYIDDLRVGSTLVEDTDDDNDGLLDVMDPLPLQAKFNLDSGYKGSSVNESVAPF